MLSACTYLQQTPTGAHNTIVTSRAGKDIVSCLVSGLLTIGPRFGGAIDDAARYFQDACDRRLDPDEFVEDMKKQGIRVPGIGHRIKSKVHSCKPAGLQAFNSASKRHYCVKGVSSQSSRCGRLIVDGWWEHDRLMMTACQCCSPCCPCPAS